MNWAGWALFGLVGTAALTATMISAQLAGPTRLDPPLLLGTLVTEDPDRARGAGFAIHLAIGQSFASAAPPPSHCSGARAGGGADCSAHCPLPSPSPCSSRSCPT